MGRSRDCNHAYCTRTFSVYNWFHVEDLEDVLKDLRWTRGGQGEDGYVREELSEDTEFFVVRPSVHLQ